MMIPLPTYLHKLPGRGLAQRALASLERLELCERRELLRKVEEANLKPIAAFIAGELYALRRSERDKGNAKLIGCWSDEEIIDAARNRFERKH